MASCKRKRSSPFQPAEKEMLLELITEHYLVVECKKTDAISVRAKTEEWMKIAKAFNAESIGVEREWTVLKNLWENLKKKAKSVLTKHCQDQIATGREPMRTEKEDSILEQVIELIDGNAEGFVNSFDNDYEENGVINILENDGDRRASHFYDNDEDEEKSSLHSTSRSRRYINHTEANFLAQAKVKTLPETKKHCCEDHEINEINKRILLLHEQQEIEKLKQEIIRTDILQEELKQLKNNS